MIIFSLSIKIFQTQDIQGFVQNFITTIANTLELQLSCTKPSIY